jgi:hypothetical protein
VTRERTQSANTMTVTVAADVTGAASAATVQINETLYFTGNYQNIDAQPANGATLTLFPGTSSPERQGGQAGLAFTKEAFAAVNLPLPMPKNEEKSSARSDGPGHGISDRVHPLLRRERAQVDQPLRRAVRLRPAARRAARSMRALRVTVAHRRETEP